MNCCLQLFGIVDCYDRSWALSGVTRESGSGNDLSERRVGLLGGFVLQLQQVNFSIGPIYVLGPDQLLPGYSFHYVCYELYYLESQILIDLIAPIAEAAKRIPITPRSSIATCICTSLKLQTSYN